MQSPPYPVCVPYNQYFNAYPVIHYQQPPSAANGYGWHGNGYGWQLDPSAWRSAPVDCSEVNATAVEEPLIHAEKLTKQNAWFSPRSYDPPACCKICCRPCCCPRRPPLEPLLLWTGFPDTNSKKKKESSKNGKNTADRTTSKSSLDLREKGVGEGGANAGGAGQKGTDGEYGKGGEYGKDGKYGKDGVYGKDGEYGKDGVYGKDGEYGKDGVYGKDGEYGKGGEYGKYGEYGKDGYFGMNGMGGVGGKGCRCCKRCPCQAGLPPGANPRLKGPCACCKSCPCHKSMQQRSTGNKKTSASVKLSTKKCKCANAQKDSRKTTLVMCKGCGHRKKVPLPEEDEEDRLLNECCACNKKNNYTSNCCTCGKKKKRPSRLTLNENICKLCGKKRKQPLCGSSTSIPKKPGLCKN